MNTRVCVSVWGRSNDEREGVRGTPKNSKAQTLQLASHTRNQIYPCTANHYKRMVSVFVDVCVSFAFPSRTSAFRFALTRRAIVSAPTPADVSWAGISCVFIDVCVSFAFPSRASAFRFAQTPRVVVPAPTPADVSWAGISCVFVDVCVSFAFPSRASDFRFAQTQRVVVPAPTPLAVIWACITSFNCSSICSGIDSSKSFSSPPTPPLPSVVSAPPRFARVVGGSGVSRMSFSSPPTPPLPSVVSAPVVSAPPRFVCFVGESGVSYHDDWEDFTASITCCTDAYFAYPSHASIAVNTFASPAFLSRVFFDRDHPFSLMPRIYSSNLPAMLTPSR